MTGTTSENKGVLVTIILLISFISQQRVSSLGKLSFGDRCTIGGHITSFFSQDREERTCDTNMGLRCTGTYCACSPGRLWDSVDGTRGCAGAAGSPCFGPSRNQQCVTNAQCQFAFCRCKPNFRPNGGHCVSTNTNYEEPQQQNSNEPEQQNSNEPRPSNPSTSGITFPELQNIFANIHNQQLHNNHQVNSFENNEKNNNNFNDRFHNGEDREGFNDRFHNGDDSDIFNDRFHNGDNFKNFNNDRFPNRNNGDYHDHQNSRDGSQGSRIRFDE